VKNYEIAMIQNTQQRIVNLWYIITLIFIVGVFIPSWLGIEGMDGGFGLSFLAGFAVIVGLIVIVVYRQRARQMDKILSGEGRMALWRYTTEEWIRFVSEDFKIEKTEKRNLFLLILIISLIIGILMLAVIKDPIIMIIIAGIIGIVAIPAFWAPRYRFRKLKHSQAEALISENGVIVGKMFHLWTGLGATLDHVSINSGTDQNIIEFTYSMPARTGRQSITARVPIPYGKFEEAIEIVKTIQKDRIQ